MILIIRMLTKIRFAYFYNWRHGFYSKFGLDWAATVVLEKKRIIIYKFMNMFLFMLYLTHASYKNT